MSSHWCRPEYPDMTYKQHLTVTGTVSSELILSSLSIIICQRAFSILFDIWQDHAMALSNFRIPILWVCSIMYFSFEHDKAASSSLLPYVVKRELISMPSLFIRLGISFSNMVHSFVTSICFSAPIFEFPTQSVLFKALISNQPSYKISINISEVYHLQKQQTKNALWNTTRKVALNATGLWTLHLSCGLHDW